MKAKHEYYVVMFNSYKQTPIEFEQEVAGMMNEGWSVSGGFAVIADDTHQNWYQPMTRVTEVKCD